MVYTYGEEIKEHENEIKCLRQLPIVSVSHYHTIQRAIKYHKEKIEELTDELIDLDMERQGTY